MKGLTASSHSPRSTVLVLLFLLLLIGLPAASATGTVPHLQNLGFEDGLVGWMATEPVVGNASVVGSEGATQWPVYGTVGVTQVAPVTGSKMLRLGVPKGTDSHQAKGVTRVSQTFMSRGTDLRVAFRLFTWEHRGRDAFVIDLKNAQGVSVGRLAQPAPEELNDDGTVTGTGPLPYTLDLELDRTEKYRDTNWLQLRITGIPPDEVLTLTYTLDCGLDAAHDTWVYVDNVNQSPVAIAAWSAESASEPGAPVVLGDTVQLDGAASFDADGDPLGFAWTVSKGGATQTTLQGSSTSFVPEGEGIYDVVLRVTDGLGASGTAPFKITVVPDNRPPTAEFTASPDDPDSPPHEGDVVGLFAESSTDPDGDEVANYSWTVVKGGKTQTYEGPVGFIVPAEDGTYDVTLSVTDARGAVGTVTRQISVQSRAPRVRALDVEVLPGGTARLLGRFLDTGWAEGHTAVWDVGGDSTPAADVDEDHVAAVGSGLVLGSSAVGGAAGTAVTGTLTVTDEGESGVGTAASAAFQVRVVADNSQSREPNDTFGEALPLPAGGAYLSYIDTAYDVDIFEVTCPDGGPLPYGTEVVAALRDLPADYDLAVMQQIGVDAVAVENYQDAPFMSSPFMSSPFMSSPFMSSPFMSSPFMSSPFMSSPFMSSPFMSSPIAHSPFMSSPFMSSPFMSSPFMSSPFMSSPFMSSPFMSSPFMSSPFMSSPFMSSPLMHLPVADGSDGVDGYPLSLMSYTGLANDNTSGIDVSFAELGFDNEQVGGLRVAGFSANQGSADEAVLATVDYVGARTFVLVRGHGSDHSSRPYTLQVETSTPFSAVDIAAQLPHDPLVTNGRAGRDVFVEVPAPTQRPPKTLFVTQAERIDSLYGSGSWVQTLLPKLQAVVGHPAVAGEVISLRANLYDAWDRAPSDPAAANVVAGEVREAVAGYLDAHPSIQYVVIVGGDRVVPHYRAPDQTVVGNEREYAEKSFLLYDSPLFASLSKSYLLTDDFYVDREPIPSDDRALYVPDVSVARLVEAPAEIAASIQAFLDADGVLRKTSALVSGADFMVDGVQRVGDVLDQAGFPIHMLTGQDWSGAQLEEALFVAGSGGAAADVSSLNAHFTHFAGLSDLGYGASKRNGRWTISEFLTGQDIRAAAGGADAPAFAARLVFSMGCHAGFGAPDSDVDGARYDTAYGIDPRLDLAEAIVGEGGLYVASTGFSYGDTVGVAGTEALIGVFAEDLVRGDRSVGLALAAAKRRYLGSLSTITPYDEKSSVGFTMYGMPQYRLPVSGTVGLSAVSSLGEDETTRASAGVSLASADTGAVSALAATGTVPSSFTLTVVDGGTSTRTTYQLAEHRTAGGTYLTADGDSQATADRPIQPRVVIPLAPGSSGIPVRGIIINGGAYVDLGTTSFGSAFDPVIARPTTEWELQPEELQVAMGGWWPAEPPALTTIETVDAGGLPTTEQRLVVNPGQFLASGFSTAPVTGTERVWSELTVEVIRAAPSADYSPPTVRDVQLAVSGSTVTVSVDATDTGGIARIDIVRLGGGSAASTSFEPPVLSGGGTYDLPISLPGVDPAEASLVIHVVDGAGNVTTVTDKAAPGAVIVGSGVASSTLLVSRGLPVEGNEGSGLPSFSGDGRYVAFMSRASNLVPGDTNGLDDIFLHDRGTGATELVNVASDGSQANSYSYFPAVSTNGRYVAFGSEATNLVAGDANGHGDIFVHDRQNGQTERVSVASDGTESNDYSDWVSISGDGRYVAFSSNASNLVPGDTNGVKDVFVRDRVAGTTERVSVATDGTQVDEFAVAPSISADGRYVVFVSAASTLVPEAVNSDDDVFVHDRLTGVTECASVSDAGLEAEGSSQTLMKSISNDGRYVTFSSDASNLVPGDTNGAEDVFVRDRVGDTTARMSVATDGSEGVLRSFHPSISGDGRHVIFTRMAATFDAVAENGMLNFFVRDLLSSSTELIGQTDSVLYPGLEISFISISDDGRYVSFESGLTTLVPGDTNGFVDIFVYDRTAATTERASMSGLGANDTSGEPGIEPTISADGRYLAFASRASNLVVGDTNGQKDVFVFDRFSGVTERVNVASDGSQANSFSDEVAMSADGRYVAFGSFATNLVPGDTNGQGDVFVHDRLTGLTERVSVASDGSQGNTLSVRWVAMSADGSSVAFESSATNLVGGDTNGQPDVFVHDRRTGLTERVSVASDGAEGNGWALAPAFSADGRYTAFLSYSSNLVPGDTNGQSDVFVHDRRTGMTERVSIASGGSQGNLPAGLQPTISVDGRYVAFGSRASNLVSGDTNGQADIFVHDRRTGLTERVNVASDGSQANDYSTEVAMSADGRYVAFVSLASNLVPGDTNGQGDIFLHDRRTGLIERVSLSSGGNQGNDLALSPVVSGDGRFVAFASRATNLVPGDDNGYPDVFVRFR